MLNYAEELLRTWETDPRLEGNRAALPCGGTWNACGEPFESNTRWRAWVRSGCGTCCTRSRTCGAGCVDRQPGGTAGCRPG